MHHSWTRLSTLASQCLRVKVRPTTLSTVFHSINVWDQVPAILQKLDISIYSHVRILFCLI
jgi:hypothetical protein